MDPEPAKGDPHTHLWSAERVEALSRNLVAPEIDSPKWAGISPQDADNLSFACTAQLLTEYLNCLNFGVSAGTIKAWHNHSYQGETSEDGMPNGHGTVQLFGGLAYTGAFTGGLLHGEGTLHWGDGLLSYTGEFFYNSIHGRGTYQWPGRASYTGQVFEGLPHGEGCMYTGEDDFCSYEGFWQHGLRQGQGKLVYGKEGKYVYEGHWDKDRKNGEGHMTYGSRSKYNGHWLEGKRHGKGHLVLMTPQTYTKTYTKNTVASLGRLDSTRVHIYEGDWISDLPHGMGQSLWAWGENEAATNHLLNKYIGEYNKGTRHGQGAFYYASGAMYKGEWKHNAKDGKGVFIYEDGHVHCGIFNFDRYDLNILPSYTFLEIVEHGLGLAQLDILLLATSSSWDTASEVHSPKRQLIFREFVEYLVKIAQRKIKSESTVDLKVDQLIQKHVLPLTTNKTIESTYTRVESNQLQQVYNECALELRELFNVTLREIGTCDGTIKLHTLDIFIQKYRPQWGVLRELLLANLLNGLYHLELTCGEDANNYLHTYINYKEFELALHLYACTTQESKGTKSTPEEVLHLLIKETIVPNLSTSISMLLNEECVRPPPTKPIKKSSVTSTPRRISSALASGRNTPHVFDSEKS